MHHKTSCQKRLTVRIIVTFLLAVCLCLHASATSAANNGSGSGSSGSNGNGSAGSGGSGSSDAGTLPNQPPRATSMCGQNGFNAAGPLGDIQRKMQDVDATSPAGPGDGVMVNQVEQRRDTNLGEIARKAPGDGMYSIKDWYQGQMGIPLDKIVLHNVPVNVIGTMQDNWHETTGERLTGPGFEKSILIGLGLYSALQNSPESQMHAAEATALGESEQAGDAAADMARDQSASAIGFCSSYVENFTTQPIWNTVRNQIFVPMAVLLLLPGAVLAQVYAIVAAGNPVLQEANPFDGILRSIIAMFMIPATALVINYGIDVNNSIGYTISSEYMRIFGSNMYRDALGHEIRATPVRQPQTNRNALDLPTYKGKPIVQKTPTAFGTFEGENVEVCIDDPVGKVFRSPPERANEAMSEGVAATRLMMNGTNASLTTAWNILCAFQLAYLYYLWCVGPIMAALWVYPLRTLRNALPSWIEGVVTICFWSLFWNTVILLMACFRGVDETGTMIMTALNFLATASVKYAFDFAGLVKAAGQEAAGMAAGAAKHAAQTAGATGARSAHSGAGKPNQGATGNSGKAENTAGSAPYELPAGDSSASAAEPQEKSTGSYVASDQTGNKVGTSSGENTVPGGFWPDANSGNWLAGGLQGQLAHLGQPENHPWDLGVDLPPSADPGASSEMTEFSGLQPSAEFDYDSLAETPSESDVQQFDVTGDVVSTDLSTDVVSTDLSTDVVSTDLSADVLSSDLSADVLSTDTSTDALSNQTTADLLTDDAGSQPVAQSDSAAFGNSDLSALDQTNIFDYGETLGDVVPDDGGDLLALASFDDPGESDTEILGGPLPLQNSDAFDSVSTDGSSPPPLSEETLRNIAGTTSTDSNAIASGAHPHHSGEHPEGHSNPASFGLAAHHLINADPDTANRWNSLTAGAFAAQGGGTVGFGNASITNNDGQGAGSVTNPLLDRMSLELNSMFANTATNEETSTDPLGITNGASITDLTSEFSTTTSNVLDSLGILGGSMALTPFAAGDQPDMIVFHPPGVGGTDNTGVPLGAAGASLTEASTFNAITGSNLNDGTASNQNSVGNTIDQTNNDLPPAGSGAFSLFNNQPQSGPIDQFSITAPVANPSVFGPGPDSTLNSTSNASPLGGTSISQQDGWATANSSQSLDFNTTQGQVGNNDFLMPTGAIQVQSTGDPASAGSSSAPAAPELTPFVGPTTYASNFAPDYPTGCGVSGQAMPSQDQATFNASPGGYQAFTSSDSGFSAPPEVQQAGSTQYATYANSSSPESFTASPDFSPVPQYAHGGTVGDSTVGTTYTSAPAVNELQSQSSYAQSNYPVAPPQAPAASDIVHHSDVLGISLPIVPKNMVVQDPGTAHSNTAPSNTAMQDTTANPTRQQAYSSATTGSTTRSFSEWLDMNPPPVVPSRPTQTNRLNAIVSGMAKAPPAAQTNNDPAAPTGSGLFASQHSQVANQRVRSGGAAESPEYYRPATSGSDADTCADAIQIMTDSLQTVLLYNNRIGGRDKKANAKEEMDLKARLDQIKTT